MEKRLVLFLILAVATLYLSAWLQAPRRPQDKARLAAKSRDAKAPPAVDAPKGNQASPESKAAKPDVGAGQAAPPDAQVKPPAELGPAAAIAHTKVYPQRWATLGSADAESKFRMLAMFNSAGAALERIELNQPRFLDLEDRSGYLGHLNEVNNPGGNGCLIRVVGRGTPADVARLRAGDVIERINGLTIRNAEAFRAVIAKTRPRQKMSVTARRDGKEVNCEVTLRRRPLEVIRPEGTDPLSLLLTLEQIDDAKIPPSKNEMLGLRLRTENWEMIRADETEVAFRTVLVEQELEIIKRYRLEPLAAKKDGRASPGFDLTFDIELRNLGTQKRIVAYQLDGPNGLPTEGWWYASKISDRWFESAGLRDVVVAFYRDERTVHQIVSLPQILARDDVGPWRDYPISYIGVDAQYFAAVLLPDKAKTKPTEMSLASAEAMTVGPVPDNPRWRNKTNTSCRVVSLEHTLIPGAAPVVEKYVLFAGPKQPAVLAEYGLGKLIYYGWFDWVAVPMLHVLHFFYEIVGNYGLAIVMLTVLVRSLMFPLSRKQVLNAQKMQELQPEIKRIHEKYKNNMEQRTKAQQELFRQHNYNPLGGCLPLFVQLPIFIGLYRSLSVDVELRGAPLLGDSIRWCSNLAAPDMLFRWDSWMPQFLLEGWLGLGPYFNLLPVITIILFVVQQKMFMPPPADEQAAMQQKVMQYMMIFMGVMFFKVPSGLCLYFIASSVWGLAERKLMPKPAAPAAQPAKPRPARAAATTNGSGGSTSKRKQRGNR